MTRTYQTNRWALAVAAFSLSAAVSVAPAKAATLSYDVSFSIQGIYDSAQYYGDGTATGSFDITYDPSLAGGAGYPNQSLSGVISSLTYTISVPELGGNLSFNPITTFTFNYGTLTLQLYRGSEQRFYRRSRSRHWYQWASGYPSKWRVSGQ